MTTNLSKRFELPALNFKFTSLTEGTDIPPPLPSPIQEEPTPVPTPPPKVTAPETKPAEAKSAEVKPALEQPVNGTANNSSKTTEAHASTEEEGASSAAAESHPSTHARPETKGSHKSLKRIADEAPASPTSSARPGSLRRLFSRNLLHSAYANGEHEGHQRSASNIDLHANSGIRPESRSNVSFVDERKARRSSGWFRRLRGGGIAAVSGSSTGDAASSKRASMLVEEPKKPAGPPPPMIPEFAQLKAKVEIDDGGSLGVDLFKNIK